MARKEKTMTECEKKMQEIKELLMFLKGGLVAANSVKGRSKEDIEVGKATEIIVNELSEIINK